MRGTILLVLLTLFAAFRVEAGGIRERALQTISEVQSGELNACEGVGLAESLLGRIDNMNAREFMPEETEALEQMLSELVGQCADSGEPTEDELIEHCANLAQRGDYCAVLSECQPVYISSGEMKTLWREALEECR